MPAGSCGRNNARTASSPQSDSHFCASSCLEKMTGMRSWIGDMTVFGPHVTGPVVLEHPGPGCGRVDPVRHQRRCGAEHRKGGREGEGGGDGQRRALQQGAERRAGEHDDFWSWRDRMYRVALRISPEALRALLRAHRGLGLLVWRTYLNESGAKEKN